MHTCIAYSSCIILTPCFAAIIDSSGSSCVWRRKGGRLVRTDLSPKSIAKEILHKLKSRPINPLCLETIPTPAEQTEEMEQQQGANWTLEDIKGALLDDIRAIIQDELRQALIGLMPPSPTAAIPIAPTIPSTADTVPTTFAVPHTIFVLPTATLTNDSRGKPLNSIKVVPTMQMKKKNVRKARKKSYQTGGTRQESTSQAVEVHVVQQSRRFSNPDPQS